MADQQHLDAPPGDAASTWLPLLQRITARSSQAVVWKNADSGLGGLGDIDMVAPQKDWPVVIGEFMDWAARRDLGIVVICRHMTECMFLWAVDTALHSLWQLEVRSRMTFRGSTVFRPRDLTPLVTMDPRGFRRLRPGSEGLLKLVIKGLGAGARPRDELLRSEGVAGLLQSDPEGMRKAARLLGPARDSVIAGAESVAEHRWNRIAMLRVEAWCRIKALAEPGVAWGRARYHLVDRKRCPVLGANKGGGKRLVPGSEPWFEAVAWSHPVLRGRAAATTPVVGTSPP
jgi:hypothetical protein